MNDDDGTNMTGFDHSATVHATLGTIMRGPQQ